MVMVKIRQQIHKTVLALPSGLRDGSLDLGLRAIPAGREGNPIDGGGGSGGGGISTALSATFGRALSGESESSFAPCRDISGGGTSDDGSGASLGGGRGPELGNVGGFGVVNSGRDSGSSFLACESGLWA